MIVAGRASLYISSRERRVEDIGARLGLTPTGSWEKDDPIRVRDGQMRHRKNSHWYFTVANEPGEDGSEGTPWLERLVDILEPRKEVLNQLNAEYRVHIWWTAEFEKGRGWTIVIPPALLARVGALGVEVQIEADEIDDEAT